MPNPHRNMMMGPGPHQGATASASLASAQLRSIPQIPKRKIGQISAPVDNGQQEPMIGVQAPNLFKQHGIVNPPRVAKKFMSLDKQRELQNMQQQKRQKQQQQQPPIQQQQARPEMQQPGPPSPATKHNGTSAPLPRPAVIASTQPAQATVPNALEMRAVAQPAPLRPAATGEAPTGEPAVTVGATTGAADAVEGVEDVAVLQEKVATLTRHVDVYSRQAPSPLRRPPGVVRSWL